MDNIPSDYYGYTNPSRTHSSAAENAYSDSEIKDFLDENVKAQNYLPNPDASDSVSDVDDFRDVKKYIIRFRESLIIHTGKGSLDSLFYFVCYAVRHDK